MSLNNNISSAGGQGHNNNNNNQHARKRSRTNSSADSHHRDQHQQLTSSSPPSQRFVLDKDQRLLRLNVGGYPYDVVRNSLPLLETMMTDRWLSSCLVDSDGRIFIDRGEYM